MAGRGFTRSRGGIKPPQRQINNQAVCGEFDGIVVTLAPTVVKALGSFGIATAVGAATIVRTRGYFNCAIVAATASSLICGAFGIITVSADAFAAGVGSMPGPITDSGDDWYVWEPIVLQNLATDPHEVDGRTSQLTHFDSRGMRKLKFGEVSAVVVELSATAAGQTVDLGYSFREQSKL